MSSMKGLLDDIMCDVLGLELHHQPKRAMRDLQKILTKYEFDESFIEGITPDTVNGWDAAISTVKEIISDYKQSSTSILD